MTDSVTSSHIMNGGSKIKETVTVGDQVQLTKGLIGHVRFIGEIQQRRGIYYGIELNESKGKSNGMVGNIRYFKCKQKRGLFLRHARIEHVKANKSIPRIGIGDYVKIQGNLFGKSRPCIGQIRYIGIPNKEKDIFYGIQLRKPYGDSDGIYPIKNGVKYFNCSKNCAIFLKYNTKGIEKIETQTNIQNSNNNNNNQSKKPGSSNINDNNGVNRRSSDFDTQSSDISDEDKQNNVLIKIPFYKEVDLELKRNKAAFFITIKDDFDYDIFMKEFESNVGVHMSSINKLEFKFNNEINNNNNDNIGINNVFTKDLMIKLINKYGKYWYNNGKFIIYEPLSKGLMFEENNSFDDAAQIYNNIIEINENNSEALLYYANCLVLLEEFDDAEKYYKKCAEISNNADDVIYFYSKLLTYLERYDESKILCRKRLKRLTKKQHYINLSCYLRIALKYNELNERKNDLIEKRIKQELINNSNNNEIKKLNLKNEQLEKAIKSANQQMQKFLKQLKDKDRIIDELNKKLGNNINIDDIKDDNKNNSNNNDNNIGINASSSIIDINGKTDIKWEYIVNLSKRKENEAKNLNILRNKLLNAQDIKGLSEASSDVERQELMKKKLELCCVICNFKNEQIDGDEAQRIENKKDLLLEVLQCMSANKWNSIELLSQCIKTVDNNLFRSLPDASMIKTDNSDDEMDFRDPSWDHLQLIYELTFHVVTNTHIEKKVMKKYLQGKFLENLIHLFSSSDDREPQYVKIIVHAIYGRFMALRKQIRKHLSNYCYNYVYTSKFRETTSWQGLPEILEIFCSIFQGLNVPVKPDYHLVLRNVVVPLHKSFHLDEFHEQLLQCCTQFVTKCPMAAPVILGGILKFWPTVSPLKEQLFITEIVHILNVCERHPSMQINNDDDDDDEKDLNNNELNEYNNTTIKCLEQFIKCMSSSHHQVAERSLMVWRDETIRNCVDKHKNIIFPKIYKALTYNKEHYWLQAIRNINRQILTDFKRRDPDYFNKIEIECEREIELQSKKYNYNMEQANIANLNNKNKIRNNKWNNIKKIANKNRNK